MSSPPSAAWATASTIRPLVAAADVEAAPEAGALADDTRRAPHTGSLATRIMAIAAGWITVLLFVGGFALDRTLTSLITRNFDDQLGYMLTGMVGSAEIGPDGEV